MTLDKSQIKYLKSLAHNMEPVIWIGQKGLTDNVLSEIVIALNLHELIKLRIRTGDKAQRGIIIKEVCRQTSAELVQTIGNTATIYLANPEKPGIKLSV